MLKLNLKVPPGGNKYSDRGNLTPPGGGKNFYQGEINIQTEVI